MKKLLLPLLFLAALCAGWTVQAQSTLVTGSGTFALASNADTLTSGPPFAAAVGDHCFAHIKHEGTAISTPASNLTVTDDSIGGNTYTFRGYTAHSNGDLYAGIYEATIVNASVALSITAHFPVGGRPFERVLTICSRPSGYTEVYDTVAQAMGTSNAPTTGSVTVAPGGNGFAAAFVAEYTSGTHTPGAGGWVEVQDPGGPYSEYIVLTSGTSLTASTAWSSTDAWIITLISDKTAGGGGGGTVVNPISGKGGAAARPLATYIQPLDLFKRTSAPRRRRPRRLTELRKVS